MVDTMRAVAREDDHNDTILCGLERDNVDVRDLIVTVVKMGLYEH